MVRTILKSDQNNLTIQLPDDLVGKLIEVIAFEVSAEEKLPEVKKGLKPSELRGFMSKDSSDAMHAYIKKGRSEWDTL